MRAVRLRSRNAGERASARPRRSLGEWIDTWEDPFDLLSQIDTCILGRGMYPGYEQYWRAIFANPESVSPFTGKVASKGEVDYALFADRTARIVVSTTLGKVAWNNTRIVRHITELRQMKQQPGKDMHAVGGASLVSSLMSAGLVDELPLESDMVRLTDRMS